MKRSRKRVRTAPKPRNQRLDKSQTQSRSRKKSAVQSAAGAEPTTLMSTPLIGLSLMLGDDVRLATYPLFEAGEVELVEWSFDGSFGSYQLPVWAEALLETYARNGRLLGHGVELSLLSGQWTERQERWMKCFEAEQARRSYRHISEHFGFMSAGDFAPGAPLPVPMTPEALTLGRDRLQRLAEIAGRPIGLENLAFAFGQDDVRGQGEFLDRLLDPIDGFLLLDLHNLYCQAANFDIEPDRLLDWYPLDRVRELHVSGGSWSESTVSSQAIRRDTHDAEVPEPVFKLLPLALARCPGVEAVIFERLEGTVSTPGAAEQLRRDYRRIAELVRKHADG